MFLRAVKPLKYSIIASALFNCISMFLLANANAASQSTSVAPLQNPATTSPSIVNKTQAGNLYNMPYSSLPTCPTTPICPDINGKYPPGGSAASCPDACTVTRQAQTQTVQGATRVLSVTPAVCPTNYVKVADYNLQPDIVNMPSPAPVYPIPDIASLNNYRNAGYSCFLNYNDSYRLYQYCAYTGLSVPYTTSNDPAVQVGVDAVIAGYVGQYVISYGSGCYADKYCNPGAPVSCGVIHSTSYYNYYLYYMCQPPGGLYYTSNLIPASVVCSSQLPQWKRN